MHHTAEGWWLPQYWPACVSLIFDWISIWLLTIDIVHAMCFAGRMAAALATCKAPASWSQVPVWQGWCAWQVHKLGVFAQLVPPTSSQRHGRHRFFEGELGANCLGIRPSLQVSVWVLKSECLIGSAQKGWQPTATWSLRMLWDVAFEPSPFDVASLISRRLAVSFKIIQAHRPRELEHAWTCHDLH